MRTAVLSATALTASLRKPLAWSYIRWSSLEQKHGDSLRRQIELRDAWIARRGVPLAQTFQDQGVSGFKGRHRKVGAFSRFLEAIQTRDVLPGDFLLVEDMDRVTREPVADALELVIAILRAGVTLCILNSGSEVTLESFNRDPSAVFMLAAAISRANSESRLKSERVTKAAETRRKRTREEGVPFTTQGKPWVSYDKASNSFVLNDKVEIVRRIFMLADHGMGSYGIMAKLADDKTPTFTGRGQWRTGTIVKLLHDRAVLGWYQPCRRPKDGDEVKDGDPVLVYPPAIDAALFQRVQDAMRPRMGKKLGGNIKKGFGVPNLFQRIAHCACCGSRMNLKPVQPKGGKRRDYLFCSGKGGKLGCTVPHNFNYPLVEDAILRNVKELDFSKVIGDDAERQKMDAAERRAADLHERHEAVTGSLDTLFNQLDRFKTESAAKLTRDRIDMKSTELASVEAELEIARTELEAVRRAAADRARGPATVEKLMQELQTAEGEDKHLLRLKLASVLRTVINDIRFDGTNHNVDVVMTGWPKVYRFKQGELLWTEVTTRVGYVTREEVETFIQEHQADFKEPTEARVVNEAEDGVTLRVRDKDADLFAFYAKMALHNFKEPQGWKDKRNRKRA